MAGGKDWLFMSYFLFLLFITKVPLLPFHSWLPAVHADSSSAVSVCLRGYIMKLGLLGLLRFCCGVLSRKGFVFYYLIRLIFLVFIVFLLRMGELDVKR